MKNKYMLKKHDPESYSMTEKHAQQTSQREKFVERLKLIELKMLKKLGRKKSN